MKLDDENKSVTNSQINTRMKNKAWITYETLCEGKCEAQWNGEPWEGSYEIGRYFSGKTRVYEGLFVSVTGPDGRAWTGKDRWCPIQALQSLFKEMQNDGLLLICAGLEDSFYATGLSDGSGFGYLKGMEDEGAFHIFDRIPSPS